MTMALILAVPRRLAEGARHPEAASEWHGLVADLDDGPPHRRQAARHHRHGPHRPGRRAPRQGLRPADPLPQPPAGGAGDRGGAGGDLLGKPRSDAGAHGHRLGQLPAHARDLPPALGAPAAADEAARLHRQHRARRGDRRERARPHAGERRARRRRPRRVRARAGDQSEAPEERQRGAAAAHGLGHDRGPHRHGREGHHQHQDLRRRPRARRTASIPAMF